MIDAMTPSSAIAPAAAPSAAPAPVGFDAFAAERPAPTKRPSKLMADLSRAMQTAAQHARDETMTRFDADAKTVVEEINAASSVEAANLRGPVRMGTTSGDLLLVDVVGDIQIESVSGDVAIRLAGPSGLIVKTTSGDTIVEGGRVDAVRLTQLEDEPDHCHRQQRRDETADVDHPVGPPGRLERGEGAGQVEPDHRRGTTGRGQADEHHQQPD